MSFSLNLPEPWTTIDRRLRTDFPDEVPAWDSLLNLHFYSTDFPTRTYEFLNARFPEISPWSESMIWNYADEVFDGIKAARRAKARVVPVERGGLAADYDSRGNKLKAPYGPTTPEPDTPYRPHRVFETGATRDLDEDKLDFEGFLSPVALESFGRYMHMKRRMPDGSLRDSDNWQKGIPLDSYMKSMVRHLLTVWKHHRGIAGPDDETLWEALCGLMFNVQGYLHETRGAEDSDPSGP